MSRRTQNGINAACVQVSKRIGSLETYRTKTAARQAAQEIVEGINRPDQVPHASMTLQQLPTSG